MGSGGGSTSVITPEIPEELRPLLAGSTASTLGVQHGLPITSFLGQNPAYTAGLSDIQKFGMERIPELYGQNPALVGAYGAYTALPELTSRGVSTPFTEGNQLDLLSGLTSGPIGSSPATQAGMEAWKQNVLPTVENEMVSAGLGRSGDLLKAVGSSASQAAFPLIQQEIENRKWAVPEYGNIGQQQQFRELYPREQTVKALETQAQGLTQIGSETFRQQQEAIKTALAAGEIQQNTAQKMYDAAYQDFLRQQGLSSQAAFGPTQMLGQTIGSNTSTNKNIGLLTMLGK